MLRHRKIIKDEDFNNKKFKEIKQELFDFGVDNYKIWDDHGEIIKNLYERTEINENDNIRIIWRALKSDDIDFCQKINDTEKYNSLENLYINYMRTKKLERICK